MALQIDSCYYGSDGSAFFKKSNRELFGNIPDRIGMTDYIPLRQNRNANIVVTRRLIGHDDYDKSVFIDALFLNKQTNKAVKLIDFINNQIYSSVINNVAKDRTCYFETSKDHCLLVQMVEPCEREYIMITIDKKYVGDI